MPRPDISGQLVHYTSGANDAEAFERLKTIIAEGRLVGGTGMIKGAYRCVCFTEAPLGILDAGFVNSNAYSRYSRFGIGFDKRWLFAQGGRPVIYQSDAEYDALPEGLRWRHVRYEPDSDAPIDFTWEREWRVRADQLAFGPGAATIVLPAREWCDALIAEHNARQDDLVRELATFMRPEDAEQHRNGFPWRCVSRE